MADSYVTALLLLDENKILADLNAKAIDMGLINNVFETSRISLSSDETIVRVIYFDFSDASMVYATNGLSNIGFKFFLFIPLEPPRAGIMLNISIFFSPHNILLNQNQARSVTYS